MTDRVKWLVWSTGGRRADGSFQAVAKAGLVVLALLSVVVVSLSTSGDYGATQAVSGDNAAPGIEALLHGHLAGYFARQPLIGLTTILLRLPFAALAHGLGGGDLFVYKFGAVACLLPLAFAAGWLLARPAVSRSLLPFITIGIVVASPLMRNTLQIGHPEDVTAATLAAAAVVFATRGRPGWSAVALGLAIGAKEWAVIAVLPVMVAVPGKRLEVGLLATGLVVLLVGVPWLADPAAFGRAVHAQSTYYLGPLSPLWPLADPIRMLNGGYLATGRVIPWGLSRTGAAAVLLVMAALLGGLWYVSLRRRQMSCSPLCLLALLAGVRCICDTAGQEYYWLVLLVAVGAWEAIESRFPAGTLGVASLVWLMYTMLGHVPSSLLYLAAILGQAVLIAYLGRQGTRPSGQTQSFRVATRINLA